MANKSVVPEAKEALNRFKMEAANEVGVNLKQGYQTVTLPPSRPVLSAVRWLKR